MSLSTLRHLALRSSATKVSLVRCGALALLQQLWPLCCEQEGAVHEVTGLMVNLLVDCEEAQEAVLQAPPGQGGPSLAQALFDHLLSPSVPLASFK